MRLFDTSVALIGLLLLSPVLVLIALLVLITSGKPVFYRAHRVGKNGRLIRVLKFRTMTVGTDQSGCGLAAADEERITRIGSVLRRYKLDELPQLVNVMKGEMRLVGPRPEDPRYVARYTEEQKRVLAVAPGITSPASLAYHDEQTLLHGEDIETFYLSSILPQKLAIELAYLQRRTVFTDLLVLVHTLLNLTPLQRAFHESFNIQRPS